MPPRQTLRNAFTTKIGWMNRLTPAVGLVVVAIQDGPWWMEGGLIVMWTVSAQLDLYDAWLKGWLVGFRASQSTSSEQMQIQVDDLMDLCDEHGVPPERVARMIWGEADDDG